MKTKRNFIHHILKTVFLMVGILTFTTSSGQEFDTSFDEWDADGDERIYENEFREGLYDETYGTDVTTDIGYDENQFYESAYDWWDANHDQRLDETEWDFGYENSYGDYLDNDFDAYDTNSDGYLSFDEYNESLTDTNYFQSWDTNRDELLDEDEYSIGSFDVWDVNDDSYLDENEFGDFFDD